jgi:hypothetical protein
MYRRTEFIAATLSGVVGLIWLVCQAYAVQTFWMFGSLAGVVGRGVAQPIGFNGTGVFFLTMLILVCGVPLGAYLHVVQRMREGLFVLRCSAAGLTLVTGAYVLAPWQFVPAQFPLLMGEIGYGWVIPAGIASVICAWTATVATVPVPATRALDSQRTSRPPDGAEPLAP